MATYRKRAGGWRVEVRLKGQYASATWQTKGQAQAWAAETETEIRAGKYRKVKAGECGDAFQRYALEVAPKHKGKRWETVRLAQFGRDALAEVRLDVVDQRHIVAFRERRLKVVAASTVRREMSLLSSVFRVATEEWKWLAHNPYKGVRRPKSGRDRDRRIAQWEIDAMCVALGYTFGTRPGRPGQEVALAFLIALETAMRANEIVTLERGDVSWGARYLTLSDSKNGDARKVPLSARALELLSLAPGVDRRLFSVSSQSVSTLFGRARDKAGLVDLGFHDSRHEAITRLARKLQILDLARMVGHRDIRSLQIYYNATATEIAERLDS